VIHQLPTSPRTTLFRAIDNLLRKDPVLSSVIRPGSFRSWSGTQYDSMDFQFSSAPGIRLTPTAGPTDFKYPETMSGDLFINVECLVVGQNVDDLLNLWGAIEAAIYPSDYQRKCEIIQMLQTSYLLSVITFTMPAFDAAPEAQFLRGMGQIRAPVRIPRAGG
jgi:hypothetical protein